MYEGYSISEEERVLQLEALRSIEPNLGDLKVKRLLEEFRAIPPSVETFKRVVSLWEGGLCLTKSFSVEVAKYLVANRKLKPAAEAEETGSGFTKVFFSVIFNKGYGPIAVSLKPRVIHSRSISGAILDHASTYVRDQMKMSNIYDEDKVMEQYRLNYDQLKTLFTYYMASMIDWPPEQSYPHHHYDEKLRFLTFDTYMDSLDLDDVETIFIKRSQLDDKVFEDITKRAVESGIAVATVIAPHGDYASEHAISDHLAKRCGLNERERKAIEYIA